MGFKFGSAAGGAAKGGLAGSTFGPWGAGIGALLGGLTGGFSKDIDKKVTGNSQSGTTNNAINLASLAAGGIGLAKNGGGGIMGMFGKSGAAPTAAASSAPQAAAGPMSYFNPTGGGSFGGFGTLPTGGGDVASGGGGVLNSFGSLIKKNPLATAGIGTALAGHFLGKSPKVPDQADSVNKYRDMVNAGGSPLNQLAQSKLTEGLNQNFSDVSQAEEAAALHPIEQQQEQELHNLTNMYKSLRPGTDPSTDTAFQRDLGMLNDRYAKTKADTVAQLHRQVYNDYQGQQGQRIGQAGQFDAQTKQAMQQIAQWDTDQIAAKFGVDYNDAQQLKTFLMNEGQAIFNSQLPNQNPFDKFFQQKAA